MRAALGDEVVFFGRVGPLDEVNIPGFGGFEVPLDTQPQGQARK